VGMAEHVKDPIAQELQVGIRDCAKEWLRSMKVPDTTYAQEDILADVRWLDDGTVRLENRYGGTTVDAHYRVSVIVEPVDNWMPGTWRGVAEIMKHSGAEEVWVRLGGVEATVVSAVVLEWNVKPGTGTAKWNPPVHEPYAVVNVRLAGREQPFTFPPDGEVEILSPPVGPAVQEIVARLGGVAL
jgi:hypothetical protein